MEVLGFVVWSVLLLILIVATLLALVGIFLIVRALVREMRKWYRDRYRRAYQRGDFEIRCDSIVASQGRYGPGLARTYQHCDRLAHWMVIGPKIVWGTGEKRCWRHHRRSAYVLGGPNGGSNVYMPVNRKTAWIDDPPPTVQEDT